MLAALSKYLAAGGGRGGQGRRLLRTLGQRTAGALLALLIAAGCTTPGAAAGPDGEAVPKAFAELTAWLRASGGGDLATAGPPVVVERSGTEVVRLPGLVWRALDAVVNFGDVEFTRTDAPGGFWRLAGKLPARVTIESPGMPATSVSIPGSTFEVELDPRNGTVRNSLVEARDVDATAESIGRMAIAKASFRTGVAEGAGGKATLISTYRLEGFVVGTAGSPGLPPVEMVRIKSIGSESRVDGVDWARLVELQALAVSSQAALAGADGEAAARRLLSLATSPDLIADGAAFRVDVEDAWIGEEAGGPVGVAKVGFRMGVSGLTGEFAAGRIGYVHEGLRVQSALPVDATAVPEVFSLEVGVERIPGRRLIDLLGASDADEARLIGVLQEAGTTARVSGARIRMDGMGADLDAEVRASASAPDGIAGTVALSVVNLDRIVAALGPMISDELAGIQLAAVMGQRTAAADGTVTHRWALARDETGRTTLNDNDISALVGDGLSGLGRGAGGHREEEPEYPGADVPESLTPAFLAARLEEFGLATTQSADRSGEPVLSAELTDALEGYSLEVQFFDCASDGTCGSCMLYLGVEPDQQVPLAKINDWISGERWVRAYRGEKRAVWLEMDIPAEGITAGGVDASIDRFLAAAERFVAQLAAKR